MAFLAQRGLPHQTILMILERAGAESVANVCAASSKDCEFIHNELQQHFPAQWCRACEVWRTQNAPQPEAFKGVKRMSVKL